MIRVAVLTLLLVTAAANARASDWHTLCAAPEGMTAVRACEAAVMTEADNPAALHQLALVLLSNRDDQRAIRLFERLANRDPGNAEVHYEHAAALATLWDYAGAKAPITRAIRLKADEPRYYLLAAIIYEQLALPDEAFVIHLRLARLGDRLGMYDVARDFANGRGVAADLASARQWYEAAAAQDHAGAMKTLAEAYRFGDLGLPADADLAAYWAERAAKAGIGPRVAGPAAD